MPWTSTSSASTPSCEEHAATGPHDHNSAGITKLEPEPRKTEYLHAVADAALEGRLNGEAVRAVDPDDDATALQEIKGLGPFAAELVVLRGANAPDVLPRNERSLEAEINERYGADRTLTEVSKAWRPYRTWAAVHLRALREQRTHEIARPDQRQHQS